MDGEVEKLTDCDMILSMTSCDVVEEAKEKTAASSNSTAPLISSVSPEEGFPLFLVFP